MQKLSENVYLVQSNSGEETYKVSVLKTGMVCTCKGFAFRRKCKHVDLVREEVAKTGRKVKVQADKPAFKYIDDYKSQIQKILHE